MQEERLEGYCDSVGNYRRYKRRDKSRGVGVIGTADQFDVRRFEDDF